MNMTSGHEQEQDWPPRLSLDPAAVLELLIGDRFYSNKDAALREAVLNAIDACTRRCASNSDIDPRIEVRFDDESLQVCVEDNGDGMDRDALTSLFARIGASMSKLAAGIEVVGEFGIGVVSYFLVCDSFEVHTRREGEAIGLLFNAQMRDATTPAEEIPPDAPEFGTLLRLNIRSQELYELLVQRYSHWFRGVEGLHAFRLPSSEPVTEGSSVEPASAVPVELPDWAEVARLGPPIGFDRWAVLDGRATVDILYRGVYVQTEHVDGLWGMEGTIYVHPKRLKPSLNREAFLIEDVQRDVVPFLRQVHPRVLHAGLTSLLDTINDAQTSWPLTRLVTLWLAVPRNDHYLEVLREWDDYFRRKSLFHRLLHDDAIEEISLNDLKELPSPIYVAPDNLAATSDVVRSATRVLRGERSTVVQGIQRDTGFLSLAAFVGQSTSDLLLNYFQSELSEIIRVEAVAEQVVAGAAKIAMLFHATPKVALVRLGEDSATLVNVLGELWINVDTAPGRAIVQSVCSENLGRRSLLIACHEHAGQQVGLLTPFLNSSSPPADRLGLVMRNYLRGLVQ